MYNMKFQSGQEFNWKYSLTENQVSEAVKDYKAKHKTEFEAKMFAELSNRTDGAVVVNRPIANFDLDYENARSAKSLGGNLVNMGVKSATTCAHTWQTHTQAQFIVPTGEANNLSGAEVNRIEMRVTKVYCTHCLEVKEI